MINWPMVIALGFPLITAGLLITALIVSRRANSGGSIIEVTSAIWRCTVFEDTYADKTGEVQKRVNQQQGTLFLLAHNDEFGDVCRKHEDPEGHPKILEVEYVCRGSVTVPYCHTAKIRSICPPAIIKRRDDLFK